MPRKPISSAQRKAIFAKYSVRKAGPTVYKIQDKVVTLKNRLRRKEKISDTALIGELSSIEKDTETALDIVKTQNR